MTSLEECQWLPLKRKFKCPGSCAPQDVAEGFGLDISRGVCVKNSEGCAPATSNNQGGLDPNVQESEEFDVADRTLLGGNFDSDEEADEPPSDDNSSPPVNRPLSSSPRERDRPAAPPADPEQNGVDEFFGSVVEGFQTMMDNLF